jgi:hypothetical protein
MNSDSSAIPRNKPGNAAGTNRTERKASRPRDEWRVTAIAASVPIDATIATVTNATLRLAKIALR